MTTLLVCTRREMAVLTELCRDGADGDTIARRLGITRDTVKSHVYRMQHKVGLSTRLELVVGVLRGEIILACKVPPPRWYQMPRRIPRKNDARPVFTRRVAPPTGTRSGWSA